MTLSYHQRVFLRQAMEEEAQAGETRWAEEELDALWELTVMAWEMIVTLPGHENEKLALRAIDLAANGTGE